MSRAIVWFRQDLRLNDNAALAFALTHFHEILPIFIWDKTWGRPIGGAQKWWLHHSLMALQKSLQPYQVILGCIEGETQHLLEQYVLHFRVSGIFFNRCYDPLIDALDTKLITYFEKKGVHIQSFPGFLFAEPGDIRTEKEEPYQVFTPFSRAARKKLPAEPVFMPLQKLKCSAQITSQLENHLSSFELLPIKPNWAQGIAATWEVGEAAAQKKIKKFYRHGIT